MFVISRTIHSFRVETSLQREPAGFIVATWGYLVPRHTRWTGTQLAEAIERTSSHPAARFDAQLLRRLAEGRY